MSSDPVIHVEGLTYTYPAWAADQPPLVVLDGVSFDVMPGRCLAVLGSAGSGKSTLCMALAGLAPRLTGGEMAGTITVSNRDVQAEPLGGLADVLGVALDEPQGQLFNQTVADEIGWGLENLGIPPDAMPARIDRALGMVGLEQVPLDQSPQTLSGGQQKRLALASALALDPQVLILDQPSAGLSPLGRSELIGVLRDLRAQGRITILMAESDPAIITALADEALLLAEGHVIARGTLADIYQFAASQPQHGVILPPAFEFSRQPGVTESPSEALTFDEALRLARPGKARAKSGRAPGPRRSRVSASSPTALTLEGVSFHYPAGRKALDDVHFTIPQGQFVALAGENGSGKTTLARHLIGLLRPASGRVLIQGSDIAGQTVGRLARQVGLAFQNPEIQIFNPTVREEIAFGPRNLGLSGQPLDAAVETAMRLFGLEAIPQHPPAVLSLSARRRVALAGVAAMNTPIIVLDEPTVGLDGDGIARLMGWLTERHRAGATILLITHDIEIAARYAERLIVMREGRVTADGDPQEVFARADLLREAGLEPPFAMQLAQQLGRPELAADLTPEGAARAWRAARL